MIGVFNMKQMHPVEIMGQKFNLKSNKSRVEVQRIVEHISDKMKKISRGKRSMSLHDIAILALLNVTDELFELKSEIGQYKEKIVHKTKRIIHLIDQPS